jgi:hypothetical protein
VRGSTENQTDAKRLGLVNVLQQLAAKSPSFKVRAKAFSLLGDLTIERHCPDAEVDHQRILLSEMINEAKGEGRTDQEGGTEKDSPVNDSAHDKLTGELNAEEFPRDAEPNRDESTSTINTSCEGSPLATMLADREHGQWFAEQVRGLVNLGAFPKTRLLSQVSKAVAHACSGYVKHNCELQQQGSTPLLQALQDSVRKLEDDARDPDVTTQVLRQALETVAVAFEQVVDADVFNASSECP